MERKEVYVLTIIDGTYKNVSVFSSKESVINRIKKDITNHYTFPVNLIEAASFENQYNEEIEEMTSSIKNKNQWIDAENVQYYIDICQIQD